MLVHFMVMCIIISGSDGDIICCEPPLEFVNVVLKLTEIWIGVVEPDCNGKVVDMSIAEVCLSHGIGGQ